jgi:hypothetical protein
VPGLISLIGMPRMYGKTFGEIYREFRARVPRQPPRANEVNEKLSCSR